MPTKIEWVVNPDGTQGETWNPVRGCTKVSPGCQHCYAETFSNRFKGIKDHPYEQGFDLRLVPEMLERPLRWRKPRKVFVCSMSDLFHEDVPDMFIDRVEATMALCPQHMFQVLTKRPQRALQRAQAFLEGYDPFVMGDSDIGSWINGVHGYLLDNVRDKPGGNENWRWEPHDYGAEGRIEVPGYWTWTGPGNIEDLISWPLPNVWLGTSVEDQKRADERIPHLLKCPAAVRFLSVEPLLGPIDLSSWLGDYWCSQCDRHFDYIADKEHCPNCGADYRGSVEDGAVVKCPHCGETDYESICDSCGTASGNGGADCNSVWGMDGEIGLDWVIVGGESGPGARPMDPDWARSIRDQCVAAGVPFFFKQWGGKNKKKAGRMLDGRTWDEMPRVT